MCTEGSEQFNLNLQGSSLHTTWRTLYLTLAHWATRRLDKPWKQRANKTSVSRGTDAMDLVIAVISTSTLQSFCSFMVVFIGHSVSVGGQNASVELTCEFDSEDGSNYPWTVGFRGDCLIPRGGEHRSGRALVRQLIVEIVIYKEKRSLLIFIEKIWGIRSILFAVGEATR